MKNPTSRQFKRVVANLDKVLPMATKRGHLDMEASGLAHDKEHICATPMCFDGFYAVANGVFGDTLNHYYGDGADLIAKHLGFDDGYVHKSRGLEIWAASNPDLWGNNDGQYMFCSIDAFDNAETLLGIRNHLAKVHNRTCKRAKPITLV